MTLQEIKDEYAKEKGSKTWTDLTIERHSNFGRYQTDINEIAKRYAKKKLIEASERAELKTTSFNYLDINNAPRQTQKFTVNKQSILETPLE